MADKEYNIKIGADTKTATQDIDNLNTALDGTAAALTDVNTVAKKTGDGLKNVGNSVPDIENAEKAIKSLEGVTKLAAGGIAASAGALALFGAEGEKLKELEVKVQGAIAVALGVREAAEGAVILVQQRRFIQEKALQAATKVSIAVQTAYNAVLALNPIALVVIAIAGLVAALIYLKDKVQIITDAFEYANKKLQQFIEFIGLAETAEEKAAKAAIELSKQKEKQYTRELNLLKAKGASDEEIYKKQREILIAQATQQKQNSDEYKDIINEIKVLDAEYTKSVEDNKKKEAEERKKVVDAAKKLNQDLADSNKKLGKDEFQQRLIDAKKAYDEQLKQLKAAGVSTVEATKAYEAQITQIQKDESKKRTDDYFAYEDALKSFRASVAEATATTLDQKNALEIQKSKELYDGLIAEAKKLGQDTTALEQAKADKTTEIEKAQAEVSKQIAKDKKDAQVAEINGSVDAIQGALGGLFEDSKGVAIANIIVDAAQAAVGIFKQSTAFKNPVAGLIFQGIRFAALAATTVASINKIKSANPSGGGGGGAPAPPSVGGFAIPTLAPSPGVPTPGNQITVPQAGEAGGNQLPIKTYVLAGDVTNAQAAEAKLNQRRTF
jgi:hypothetical protein